MNTSVFDWKRYSEQWYQICELFDRERIKNSRLMPEEFANIIVDRFGKAVVMETFALVIRSKGWDGRIYDEVKGFFPQFLPAQVVLDLKEDDIAIYRNMTALDNMHSVHINQTAKELMRMS